jgi:pyridoxamine 5'-phosphate oxidase
MTTQLEALRAAYMAEGFDLTQAAAEPVTQFVAWLAQVEAAGVFGPRAMTLATTNAAGRPSARLVMLAGCDARGFAFCTDAGSPKARDLAQQPWAALVFNWGALERQVRVEGPVEPIADDEADRYFARRASAARLAAWAGRQSAVIRDRAGLEARLIEVLSRYEGQAIPRPPYYAGYRVAPALVEFWQGRADRLHDRVRYERLEGGRWLIERLAP